MPLRRVGPTGLIAGRRRRSADDEISERQRDMIAEQCTKRSMGRLMSRDLARTDLTTMSSAQREMLWTRLSTDEVPYWFDGESVVVHAPDAEALRAAMVWVTNESAPTIRYATPRLLHQIADDGSIVAPRTRRFVAAWLDGAVFEVAAVTVDRLDITPWAAVAAFAAYVIGATHLAGQTAGKQIVGIEVVAVGTAGPPSWVRASLRWLTTYAPLIVAVAL